MIPTLTIKISFKIKYLNKTVFYSLNYVDDKLIITEKNSKP